MKGRRYNLCPIQIVADTICARYNLCPISFVPDTICAQYNLCRYNLCRYKLCRYNLCRYNLYMNQRIYSEARIESKPVAVFPLTFRAANHSLARHTGLRIRICFMRIRIQHFFLLRIQIFRSSLFCELNSNFLGELFYVIFFSLTLITVIVSSVVEPEPEPEP
jgi:hypothetical protein